MYLQYISRTMINQYLCRNYIANELTASLDFSRTADLRMEDPYNNLGDSMLRRKIGGVDKSTLISDEGSSAYKDWLVK